MEQISLTKEQARNIIIDAAGLARKVQFEEGTEAVYRVIDHFGHHHVMAARVPDYQTKWLANLCEDGRIYEYIISDAGYLPMQDFRFSLPVKGAFETQVKLHLEPVDLEQVVLEKFIQALKEFVQFNQCQDIIFKKSNNEGYLNVISKNFS